MKSTMANYTREDACVFAWRLVGTYSEKHTTVNPYTQSVIYNSVAWGPHTSPT